MKSRPRYSVRVIAIFFLSAVIAASLILSPDLASAQNRRARKAAPTKTQAGRKVSEIVITGNKKIEKAAIEASLKTKVGSSYSSELVREDIESIFKLGYFYDIQVDRQDVAGGVRLTYKIVEKPSVVEIVYRGNDEL